MLTNQITLVVTKEEAAILIQGLGELPAKFSYGLITKLEAAVKSSLADTVGKRGVADE